MREVSSRHKFLDGLRADPRKFAGWLAAGRRRMSNGGEAHVPYEYHVAVDGELLAVTAEEAMQRTAYELLRRSFGYEGEPGFEGTITVHIVPPLPTPIDPDAEVNTA